MYAGYVPFEGKTEYLIFLKSTVVNYEFPVPEIIPEEAKSLIASMIQLVPDIRPSIEDLINNTFFDEVRDLVSYPSLSTEESYMKELQKDLIKNYSLYKLESPEKVVYDTMEKLKE